MARKKQNDDIENDLIRAGLSIKFAKAKCFFWGLITGGIIGTIFGFAVGSADGAVIEDAALRQQNNPQGISDTVARTSVDGGQEAHGNVYASLSHE